MEYQEIIHYFSLMLILGTIAEIYVRQKGLGVKEKRMRDGKVYSNKRSILPPLGLLLVSIVVAVLTVPK
jgi:hypothetical protein